MRTRRLLLVALVAGLLALGAMPSASANDTAGDLQAAFHAGLTGGYSVTTHSPTAAAVASPVLNPAGRIRPFLDGQVFCSDTPLGIWVNFTSDDPVGLQGIHSEFTVDGVALDEQRAAVKRFSGEAAVYWFAEGVPVLGTLPVGEHWFEWAVTQAGETFTEVHSFSVIDCG